ncbi:MAG: hypothetical protein JXB10_04580 [Pirellulales bacterium]|nr:hypothetical protein [Pirellulales bacterium]
MLRPRSAGRPGLLIITRGAMLLGGTVLCGIPTSWWAWEHSRKAGLQAVVAAGGLCLLGALLALPCTILAKNPKFALLGALLGMAIRSGIPLGFGIGLHFLYSPLAKTGFLYYLVVFYIPLLALETYWSVPSRDK